MENAKRVAVDLTGADSTNEILKGVAEAIRSGVPVKQLIGICDEPISRLIGDCLVLKDLQIVVSQKSPSSNIKERINTPIWEGISMLRPGATLVANAFVSTGNTGTVVRSAVELLLGKMTAFFSRPAIAAVMPHAKDCLIADVGANLILKPNTYLHLATMCNVYAETVFGIKSPGIRIMNVGTEEDKGTLVVQEAHKLLKGQKDLNYLGYIEGNGVAKPDFDTNVILCDGFVGNVILKLWEGLTGRGQEIGGCPLLGINGNIIIAHGSSSSVAYCNAILAAVKLAETDLDLAIQRKLRRIKD